MSSVGPIRVCAISQSYPTNLAFKMSLDKILKQTKTERFDSLQVVNRVLFVTDVATICVEYCSSLYQDFERMILTTFWRLTTVEEARRLQTGLQTSGHPLAKLLAADMASRHMNITWMKYISGPHRCERLNCWPNRCNCFNPVIRLI